MAHFLIIAATSGIGRALVEMLHHQGHSLFLTGRDESKISALAEKYSAQHAVLDATNFDAVDAVFDQAQQIAPLSGAVCLSGSLLLKPAHATTYADYQATVQASLTTAFATVRSAGKIMKQGGSVVLIGSGAGLHGYANHEAIASAKAGIVGLAQSAAATYATQNLRFNVVAPGLTETPLTASLTGNETMRKVSEKMHALGRLGTPEHIASAIAFFLDSKNDWITGQVLAVDGGLSSVAPKIKA